MGYWLLKPYTAASLRLCGLEPHTALRLCGVISASRVLPLRGCLRNYVLNIGAFTFIPLVFILNS